MLSDAISLLLKISLTMFTFVSFLNIIIIFFIKPNKTIIKIASGLGLFFISSIMFEFIMIGYNNAYLSFSQYLTNILANIFIAEVCINYLNKKLKSLFVGLYTLTLFFLVMSSFNFLSATYSLVSNYTFLLLINLYISVQFFKTNKTIIINKNLMGTVFLIVGLMNISNYFLIGNSVYHITYFIAFSIIMMSVCIYAFLVFHKYNENMFYEKEACFDDTFNNSGIGMAITKINGTVVRVNKTLCETFGYTEEDLKNKTSKDVTFPEDFIGDKQEYRRLLQGDIGYFQKEKRYIHYDGHIIHGILNASLIRNKAGKPLYFVAQIQDISNHIALQEELKRSSEKYETLLNSYDNPIAIIDRDNRIVIANKYILDKVNILLGRDFSPDSIIGQRINDFIPGIEKTDIFKVYNSVMTSRVSKSLTSKFINPRGETVWYEFRIFPSPEGVLVISANVTEEVKNQQRINESELKYRSLVEQSLDGTMLIDSKGYIIEFNSALEKITGYNKCEILGNPIWSLYNLFHDPESQESTQAFKELVNDHILMDKYEFSNEIKTYKMTRKDGAPIFLQHFFYPILAGDSRMICCVCRDITELKRLEEAEERAKENERLLLEKVELERLRTEFFANLSHEFRTPLNIVLTSNKMLYDKILKSDYPEKDSLIRYLCATKLNSNRLLRLINNILDITKIDSGFSLLNLQCCNIVEVAEELTQLTVKYAEKKDINITFDTDVEEKLIMCDTSKVDRIILNLLSNSVKFTEPGGSIEVTISDMDEYAEIRISDNGIGIPEERLPQIFEGFRQVDKSLTRGQEGSGIGLALVKALVEMHNGEIEITSKEGEGTCVILKLPAGDVDMFGEVAISAEMFEDKSEKVNLEFSDIYF